MNAMKNHVQLIGNLGNDPEIHSFENDRKLAKFNLATNEVYVNKDGEKITQTQWHRVVFFGKTAETIEKYLKKGKEVAITGKITYREYEDKEGVKRYITEIVGNELLLLGAK
jgi:single-strand DNA-binding protein